jgi:four helix bundle protein
VDRDELQERTKQFALRTIRLVDALPRTIAGREIGRQLIRSSTSASANYRASRRARSRKEFVAKLGIVVEEADESAHWLELIIDAEMLSATRVEPLRKEAEELTRIFATARRTARTAPSPRSPNPHITKSPDSSGPESNPLSE